MLDGQIARAAQRGHPDPNGRPSEVAEWRRHRMMRSILGVAAALCLGLSAASAEPKTVSLWHPFTLETDMIHGAIKSFNESQSEYRIDPRIVPGPQISTELVKAVASGSVPDLVTIDNPIVASFSAQGSLTDLTDRVSKSRFIKPDIYFKGPW